MKHKPRSSGPYTVRLWRCLGEGADRKHEHVSSVTVKTRGEAEAAARRVLEASFDQAGSHSATVTDAGGEVVTSYSARFHFTAGRWGVRREHVA